MPSYAFPTSGGNCTIDGDHYSLEGTGIIGQTLEGGYYSAGGTNYFSRANSTQGAYWSPVSQLAEMFSYFMGALAAISGGAGWRQASEPRHSGTRSNERYGNRPTHDGHPGFEGNVYETGRH